MTPQTTAVSRIKQAGLPIVNPKFVFDKPAALQIQAMTKEDQDRLVAELGKKEK